MKVNELFKESLDNNYQGPINWFVAMFDFEVINEGPIENYEQQRENVIRQSAKMFRIPRSKLHEVTPYPNGIHVYSRDEAYDGFFIVFGDKSVIREL